MGKYPEIEEKMEKRINGYAGELKTIRAGRANASVLDKVAIAVSYTHLTLPTIRLV